MIIDDPNDLDDFERRMRFDEIAAEFGRSIAAFECAPWVREIDLLARDGLTCPAPDALAGMGDEAIHDLLWRVFESLARRNVFLSQTDHLSDRELYAAMYDELFQESTKDFAAVLEPHELTGDGAWAHHWPMLADAQDDAGARVHAAYYVADDDAAERAWLTDLLTGPEPLPARREPPYDRDRYLPSRREDGPGVGDGEEDDDDDDDDAGEAWKHGDDEEAKGDVPF